MQFIPKKIGNKTYTLNGISLRVLHLIHQKKSIEEIKKTVSLTNEKLNNALNQLLENELIDKVFREKSLSSKKFTNLVKKNLAKAIGPLAEYLVEDVCSELKIDSEKITKNQAASMIRFLSEEIKDNTLKINFIKTMNQFLK
ncbi:MAG: hypothetical protein RBR53_04775 [Desulforegulaceae bacterium]|nr:hypothetical protein [Desulforegulaceae bacterium]